MRSRIWHLGVSIIMFYSCDSFIFKKENKEEIVKKQLEQLDWNLVDQAPLFKECKEKIDKGLEECFQNTITQHIHSYLAKQKITVDKTVNDTIWIPLLITKEGAIVIENFDIPQVITATIPNLKQLLTKGIQSLPEVEPAHTRGTLVTTRYKLPIVIHMD